MGKVRLDDSPEAALRWLGAPLQKPLIAACALGLALCTAAAVTLTVAPEAAETQVRATILVLLERELGARFGVDAADSDVGVLAQRELRQRIDGVRRTLASALSIHIYVNGQSWLMSFVFSDYAGWAYLAWASVLLAWLIDLVFLRAWITNLIVNAVGGAVSGH